MRRHVWKIAAVVLLVLAGFIWYRYYWVFGEGAKAGELNYVVHKGYLFKTWEGKLIQTGVHSQDGTFKSFEFMFSVEDEGLAERLMANSGHHFTLHYKEFKGALPWRGNARYVVDSIIAMKEVAR